MSHLEPDILESETKWALGSITTNKVSGGDGIPVELFQILKDDANPSIPFKSFKCCTHARKFGKLSSGHRTGKGQFSFQSQRKAMPRNAQTTHNYTHLTRQHSNAQNSPSQASTVHEPRPSRCSSWTSKRQRNQRSNCQHQLDHRKSKGIPEKHLLLFH